MKKSKCLIWLVIGALIVPPSTFAQSSLMEMRSQARSAFQAGDYNRATDLYRQIAAQNPKLPILKETMWSLWNMQKSQEAVEVAQAVLKISPSDEEAKKIVTWAPNVLNRQKIHDLQDQAKQAYQSNQYEQAIQAYRQIIELDPNNISTLKDFMWILWNTKRVDEAMSTARKILALRPSDGDAAKIVHKGGIFNKQKLALQPKEPTALYLERITKNPSDSEAYRKLAWTYFNKGNITESMDTLEQLLAIKPQDAKGWAQLGQIRLSQQNYTKAIEAFEKSLAINPSQPRVSADLARSYAQVRDLGQATVHFNRAYEENRGEGDFLPTYAKVLFYNGDFRQSKEIWSKVVADHPDNTDYQYREAEAQYYSGQQIGALEKMRHLASKEPRALQFLIDNAISRGDNNEAVKLLEQSTRELSGDKARDVIRLARLYLTEKRPIDSYKLTQRWLALFPDDMSILVTEANALEDLKRPTEAISILRRLLHKNPYMIDAYINMAEVQYSLGDKASGLKSMSKALALEPTNPYIFRHYTRMRFDAGYRDEARKELTNWLAQNNDRTVLPILLYHGLSAFEFTPMLAYEEHMTAVSFENQMSALAKNGYHSVTVKQVMDWYAGKGNLPVKPVLITFDDARLDSFQLADDILAHYGFTATMFVPSDNVEKQGALGYASWSTINQYRQTGRWNMESHGGEAHGRIRISEKGEKSLFLLMPQWLEKEQRVETTKEWTERVDNDHEKILRILKEKTDSAAIGYAYPEGLYGQQSNSDKAVPLNVDAVKRHYKSAFIQDNYGMNLRTQDPYFLRRIEPKMDWSGADMIAHLREKNPRALIYKDFIYMSLYERRVEEARQWLEQLQQFGVSGPALWTEQAKIEYAANNSSKAYQLAMQSFVADPSPANEKLLTEMRPHLGLSWHPMISYQKDNQTRESWAFDQELAYPLSSWFEIRASQGVANFKESGVEDVRDSSWGGGFALSWNNVQRLDINAKHNALSGTAEDFWGGSAVYRAKWASAFQTEFEARKNLYGSARAINANVHEKRYRGLLHFGRDSNWGLSLRGRLSELSGDNERQTGQAELGMPFSEKSGLGLVYQYTYDDMKRVEDLYYSPQNLQMHELGPQWALLVNNRLKVMARYLPGIAKEDGVNQQFVQGATGQVEWSVGKNTSLSPSISYEETPTYNYFLSMLAFQHEF